MNVTGRRHLPKGERITFLDGIGGSVLQGRVQHASGGRRFTVKRSRRDLFGFHYVCTLYRRDEGVQWVRGWGTDATKALFVATALEAA